MKRTFKNSILTALSILTLSLLACQNNTTNWDIREFGAVGDSTTINTEAIQAAIDTCNASGGGIVIIPDGVYISGTILLKSNVTLHISENAKLVGSANPNDYRSIDPFVDATGQLRGKCLIGAIDAKNICITGKGHIDGRGDLFTRSKVKETLERLGISELSNNVPELQENPLYLGGKVSRFDRPFLIRLVRTEKIRLEDISLRQPAAWTLHFYQCKDFEVKGIQIFSHANKNNDGIDIDSSSDGLISDCTINSGDDAICFKATSPLPSANVHVRNCRLKSDWGAIKFGTESMGDFRDISIKNCFIHDTRGGGIKILSVDGANIRNIVVDSIKMKNVEMPVFIRLGERRLVYRDAPRQEVGSIDSIFISNLIATVRDYNDCRIIPATGMFFTGTPNHKIGAIFLDNIHISLPGGGSKADSELIVAENETDYPEFTRFGALPAYGIYARHIEKLETENISFRLDLEESREESVMVNVNE